MIGCDIDKRKMDYIRKNSSSENMYSLVLQLRGGATFNNELLKKTVEEYLEKRAETGNEDDFVVAYFIRLIYISAADDVERVLEPVFADFPFWIEKGERRNCYWSENHLICYLSIWYLWNQRKSLPLSEVGAMLDKYLKLKIKYGFFECMSQVYNAYTLAALLNIADFAEDHNIKNMATTCIQMLTSMFLQVILPDGSIYCAAGRTYQRYKVDHTKKNFNKYIHLISGISAEDDLSPLGAFYATSTVEMSYTVADTVEKTYKIGDGVKFDKEFGAAFSDFKTINMWSSGNYFDSGFVDDTVKFIKKYDLWDHAHFKMSEYETIFKLVPLSMMSTVSDNIDAFVEGSDLRNVVYKIYRKPEYTLTCLENYNRGKMGAQQCPWIANVGGVPVFTQAGKIAASLGATELHETVANTHLPCVLQSKNVALIMYQPYAMLSKAFDDLKVYLYMDKSRFDQVIVEKYWIYGRKGRSYIAVYTTEMTCGAECIYNKNEKQQGWVVILGDADEYTTFELFVENVRLSAKVSFSINKTKSVLNMMGNVDTYYYGKVKFGAAALEMKW